MAVKFTQKYLDSIKATGKVQWFTDAGYKNLLLYVGATGNKVFYLHYRNAAGQRRNHRLGSADFLTVAKAQDKATDFKARLAKGEGPDKKAQEKLQLGEFVEEHYGPWVEVNRKTGKETMAILRSSFDGFFNKPIVEMTKQDLEQWRMKRQETGSKSATINRLVTALKAALNWGVDQEYITSNPIDRLKPLQEHDSEENVRYLKPEERTRLLAALDERETRLRTGRNNHIELLPAKSLFTIRSLNVFLLIFRNPTATSLP